MILLGCLLIMICIVLKVLSVSVEGDKKVWLEESAAGSGLTGLLILILYIIFMFGV